MRTTRAAEGQQAQARVAGVAAALAALTAVVVLAGACDGCKKDQPGEDAQAKGTKTSRPPARPLKGPGLAFRLSPGEGMADRKEPRTRRDQGQALSAQLTRKLLARLPAVAAKASDREAFAFRARSLPPPRTGKTITTSFPPPARPAAPKSAAAGPLTVLRAAPEGDVGLAPNLSVTFSQPMVAVTSHADTLAKAVPVKVSPAVKGQWRWIGARTLLFEPKPRFAMATSYQVSVPRGTKSARGGTLAKAKRWTFSTPTPRLLSYRPSGRRVERDALFYLGFDQRIDPAAVLKTVTLKSDGGKSAGLKLASAARIEQDEQIAGLVQGAEQGRWLAFTASRLLEADTRYTVTIGPGTPSAEGPRKTKEPRTFQFRTYAPLQVEWRNCSSRKCTPGSRLSIRFNNPLDEELFDAKSIKVTPAIPELRVVVRNTYLSIQGATRGRTTYKVRLPAGLRDIYGQSLGRRSPIAFDFKSATPRLRSDGRQMRVLDPKGEPVYTVRSINHKRLDLKVYKVQPGDWKQYLAYRRGLRDEQPPPPPGKLALAKQLKPAGDADQWTTTKIDLRRALSGKKGQLVVVVRQVPWPAKRWERQVAVSWVQSTNLALDAFSDRGQLLAWVTRLTDGKAVAGATVTLQPDGISAKSDARGLARLELPETRDHDRVLVASAGGDRVLLPSRRYGRGWQRRPPPGESARWYVFDDRKLYRPKEQVRIKGWVRLLDMGSSGGIRLLPAAANKVAYVVLGPRRNKVARGQATIGPLGGFDFTFKLPDAVNLGWARVLLSVAGLDKVSGTTRTHRFRIQEFRRPEFEVAASGSAGPHLVGGHAEVQVKASYFAGGPLPNTEVNWRVSASGGHFTPPNLSGYTFVGSRPHWWQIRRRGAGVRQRAGRGRRARGRARRGQLYRPGLSHWDPNRQTFAGRTNGRGLHSLRIDFDAVDPPRPASVSAVATIKDVNRQSWTSSVNVLVHPASHYVGLKTARYFVKRGQPLKVEAIVSDLEGKPAAGRPITIRAHRVEHRYEKGSWVQKAVDPQQCKVTSKVTAVTCSFTTQKGGSYLLEATIKDPEGRTNQTVLTRWVSGGRQKPERRVKVQSLKLVADKKRYQPGETAQILVQSPFAGAEGLMTLRRAGIVEKQRFRCADTSATLKVAIKESYLPGLTVGVELVGAAARVDEQGEPVTGAPPRPALAAGSVYLSVPPLSRKLALTVKPRKKRVAPGAENEIVVRVNDAAGKAVADAEVAVVVVDESVLALTGYSLADPVGTFYPGRYGRITAQRLRPLVSLDDPHRLRRQRTSEPRDEAPRPASPEAPGSADDALGGLSLGSLGTIGKGGGGGSGAGYGRGAGRLSGRRSRAKRSRAPAKPAALAVRQDFKALALFAPALRSDAAGEARVSFKMPDSLTRYRVMAVAVAGAKYYGKGEATVTARRPLMVRPSPPRFLNFGDHFELPVVLQNQTERPLSVQVAVRATNAELVQGDGRLVTVPANDRLELRFASKAVQAGVARFQIGVVAGDFTDAAQLKIPVWTPATTEAFATYGAVDSGAMVQPVKMPANVITSFGGLEIGTSSTALQALTDAVLYLVSYRYECAEQLSSRVLAVAALRDVLTAFKAPGLPAPEKMIAAVDRDLKRLRGMQNSGGGFPIWERGRRSWPFVSVHVTHALVRAKLKGFAVPPRMYSRALSRLRSIESIIPGWYSKASRRAVQAYSLYVRALAGDPDKGKARRLLNELLAQKKPSMESIGWLYPVLTGTPDGTRIRALIKNRVAETAATAHFVTSYSDGAHVLMHSSRRVDGVLLEGLIKDQPRSDLIPKLVRGLLGHRKRGRWSNTQENAWVLLALDRYFARYEKVRPNFVARAWLGPRYAGDHAFRGRTTERHEIKIPMKVLADLKGSADLTLAKQGPGRLYYRVGLRYAPADLKPPPTSHGFTVRRSYEAVDEADDVQRDKDGTWRVKAGARVRVRLRMVTPARRYHVALVDPLPAGLEPLNSALRGTQRDPGQLALSASAATRRGRGRGLGGIGTIGRRRGRGYWRGGWGWRSRWYEHVNLRDERAEVFASLVYAGVHSYAYVARATTPGTFVVPPPKAEEMYHPETFGRGPGDRLIVE